MECSPNKIKKDELLEQDKSGKVEERKDIKIQLSYMAMILPRKKDMAKYRELLVFQKADELAYKICKITENFPKEEIYGITSQMRRAALSVPSNIVEGYARKGENELRHFLNIALGSLAELEFLVNF